MTRQHEEKEGRKPYAFFTLTTGQPCLLEYKDSTGPPGSQGPIQETDYAAQP